MDIPGYTIRRLLARGGSSSVFVAVQQSLGREVALKILRPAAGAVHAERFLAESRILAALGHHNVITIHDVGTMHGWYYIAMEYLRGGSLEDRITKPVPPAQALEWLKIIGAVLDFVHGKGIVHRDIKPANILFHGDGTLKLSDFGIAKRLASDQGLTLDGRTLGSPYYLSPEQAECKVLDGRSDIYSLGIMFYEMLTGRKPFVGASSVQTILYHLTHPVPLLPPEFRAYQGLLRRMIAKEPADRFSSAAELLAALETAPRHPDVRTPRIAGPLWPSRRLQRTRHRGLRLRPMGKGLALRRSGQSFTTGIALAGLTAIVSGMAAFSAYGTGDASVVLAETTLDTKPMLLSAAIPGDTASARQLTNGGRGIVYPPNGRGVDELVRRALASAPSPSPSPSPGQRADLDPPMPAVPPNPGAGSTLAVSEETPGTPPDPAAADGSRRSQIDDWLTRAEAAMATYRLTVPAEASAYSYYRRVLERDPRNAGALRGLLRIADTYALLAQRRLAKRDHDKAAAYVERGLAIRPRHERLTQLAAEIESARQPHVPATPRPPADPVARFFQRVGAFVTHPSNKPGTDLLNH